MPCSSFKGLFLGGPLCLGGPFWFPLNKDIANKPQILTGTTPPKRDAVESLRHLKNQVLREDKGLGRAVVRVS